MFLNENAACLNVLAFSGKNALVKYMPENELGISDSEPVPDSMDYGTYKETKAAMSPSVSGKDIIFPKKSRSSDYMI